MSNVSFSLVSILHEWALAEAMIGAVLDVAKKENAEEVLEINIVVGELQTIDLEIFKTALESIKEETIARNAKINFISEEPCFKCNVCGYEWCIRNLKEEMNEQQIESVHFIPELVHVFISCPRCGKHDFEITKGRGLYLASIRVKKK